MSIPVVVSVEGSVGWITLNRPEKLNALTPDMYATIEEQITTLGGNDRLHCVAIRGAGRALSAGFDRTYPVNDLAATLRETNRSRWAVWNCPIPVVVIAHGYCLGGALELTYPADLVIASDECLFGLPEVTDGVTAGFDMLPWLMNHKMAKATMLTGALMTAQQAALRGLVTHVVPLDQLREEATRVLGQLEAVPRETLVAIKASTNRVVESLGMVETVSRGVADHEGRVMFRA